MDVLVALCVLFLFIWLIRFHGGVAACYYQVSKAILEPSTMRRPMGVTCIAILYFAAAVFCVVVGIGGLNVGWWGHVKTAHDPNHQAIIRTDVVAGAGAFIGFVFFVVALINALIARGLWKMKNTWRAMAIGLSMLWIFLLLWVAVIVAASGTNASVLSWLVVLLCVHGWTIWYLLSKKRDAAFTQASGQQAAKQET